MRFYLVFLGSAISIYAALPYLQRVRHLKVKPRLVTWLSWAVCAVIAGIGALMDHELAAAIFSFVVAAESAAVIVLGANNGDRTWDNVDMGVASGVILALCGLLIIGSPMIAIIIAILTYCLATVPSYINLSRNTKSEKLQLFALTALSELVVLGSVNFHSFTGYAFTGFLLLDDLTMIGIIFFEPKMDVDILPAMGLKSENTPYAPVPTDFHNGQHGVTPAKPDMTTKTVLPTPPKPEESHAGSAAPPTATFTLSPTANKYGWNNSDVTINFKSTTSSTSISTEYCTPPVKLSKEGANQRITGTVIDSNNQTSRVVASVNIDFTPPQISNLTFSANPITSGQSTHISVAAVDTLAGVLTGEYFVGNSDPGPGKGHLMTLQGNILSTFLRYDWAPGTYPLSFRAQDLAGNWSPLLTANLVIQARPSEIAAATTTSPPAPAAVATA